MAFSPTTSAALRYWNMARQRYCRRLARYRNTLRVSADPVAKPAAHTRAESRGSRPSKADAGERRTVCWREVDSNFRFRHPHHAAQTGLSETDQCTTEQGVGRVPASPALSSRPPVDSNSVTSGPAEFDPVLRAPLPQSRLLGLVREIVPPFEGAPPHQQLLISAVSTSSAEDVANFVVVVG